ncbi:MAG: glycosyltransferase family 4 protein [Planctomycetes bacterium]|jgi:glycosyltransferase involved in cell wall biosynthesis|nr:glycosyltransferase family 4 protein [Planctomycetota bacterium]
MKTAAKKSLVIGIDASRANREYKTGTEWYSYYLIKRLAEIDQENQYLLYSDKPLTGTLLHITETKKNFQAKVLKWPWRYFWTLGRLSLEMIFKKPDVLFVPAHTLPFFSPRKTITTIHDIAFTRDRCLYNNSICQVENKSFKRLLNFFVKFFTFGRYQSNSVDYLDWSTKFALKKAKTIITVSEFTKKELLETYSVNPNKIVVIHNGYNSRLYQREAKPEAIKKTLDKYGLNQPFFLYVGRLEKKKNTPALIEAYALLREEHPEIDHELVLIGNASFGYDEVKYIIEEFDLDSKIKMLGWVEEQDMPLIFHAASTFIFPSKHEGFGIPVIQALACGIPTAVSDIPVLKEIAGEAVLTFDPNDKKDIMKAMYEVATDQNLRKSLIKKGYQRAENFSWFKCAQETLNEIEKL